VLTIRCDNAGFKRCLPKYPPVDERRKLRVPAGRGHLAFPQLYRELTIAIPVDTQYNGKTATILHAKHDGTLQTLTATVQDGKATFTVTELSPFAVFAEVSHDLDDIPKVGDNAPWIWWLLFGASAASVVTIATLSKKRRLCKR
jgi:hypothetical protein